MDETSPLLGNWSGNPPVGPDILSPNLRPRHQELIPTPCGPIKSLSELSCLLKLYFCFTIASLLALLGLTSYSMYKQRMYKDLSDEEEFTVSLVQLIGLLFCIYYICRGVLQENRQELGLFGLSMLVVIARSGVNFWVLAPEDRQNLLVRFVCIMCLGIIHVLFTVLLMQSPNRMAFRVGGALDSVQKQYLLLNRCFSMVTFDLQAQVCSCILITAQDLSTQNIILLTVGVAWAFFIAVIGAAAVLKEVKVLVWVFMALNLPQVGLFVYLLYLMIVKWCHDNTLTLEVAGVSGVLVSVLIKVGLLWGLVKLMRNFGQGLRQRMCLSRMG